MLYRRTKRLGMLVTGLLITVLLAACGQTQAPATTPSPTTTPAPSTTPGQAPAPGAAAVSDKILRIGMFGTLPRNLNPFDSQGRLQADLENVYEPLLYPYRDTFELRGVLAESWSVNADGTVWTFKLRKGVNFTDGTPFNAKAIKPNIDFMLKVKKAQGAALLDVVKEVREVDEYTVEFVVEPKGMPLPHRLTGTLFASPKAIADHQNDPDWFAHNAVGTGPYKVENFVVKDRMTLARNDQYWGPKPYFAKVVYLEIPEQSAQALMLENGELDISYNLPPESIARFEKNPKLKVMRVRGDRVMNVRLNVTHGPLTNKDLRLALAYAMDYDALLKAREFEISAPDGPVPAQYLGDWTPPGLIRKQDLNKAKEHLAKAGYQPGQLTLDMYFPLNSSVQQTAAEVLQASLSKIGVTLKLHQTEFNPMYQQLQRFAKTKNPADAVNIFTLIRGPYVPHPFAYFSSYIQGGPNNFMAWKHPSVDVDALMEQGFRAPSDAAAMTFYKQAIERIVEDQPDLWLYVEKRLVVMRSDLEGYYLHPTWFPETHVFPLRLK